MLIAVVSVLIALALIDRAVRMARVDSLALATRYRLFDLRDMLRQAAIDGTADANSWVFDYLDTSITRAANGLAGLNMFELAYYATQTGKSEAVTERVRSLNVELNRRGNSRLRAIHEGFQKCILEFLAGRHRASLGTARLIAQAAQSGRYVWLKWKKRGAIALACDPKISTLHTYCN